MFVLLSLTAENFGTEKWTAVSEVKFEELKSENVTNKNVINNELIKNLLKFKAQSILWSYCDSVLLSLAYFK